MESNRFDDLGRALGRHGSRRGIVRMLVGVAIGTLASSPPEALTKPKKKKKKVCPKKPCPKGYGRDKRTCACECVRKPCSGGMEFDTTSCSCRCPRDMRECRDGCVGKNECCPGDPPCPEDPKGCCHAPALDVCTIDGCCREIDGIKACNDFCVDTNTNRNHCGDCNSLCGAEEVCADGECQSVELCPDGRPPCPGKPGSDGPFCRPQQHESCCGDTSCNALKDCCDPEEGVCCLRGRCTEGRCCNENREMCGGKCCLVGQICCGTECCSALGCVNGTCCEMDSCGAVDAANRICTGPNETCCRTGPDNSGFACPSVDWGSACAANGRCCPEGTFYEDSCDKCCADVRDLCEDCLPTIAGRF